ncbi:MAG: SOS response-associated peptidase [Eubacteriaceae bacterium]|nr:SOS response-associated peptidase [Eubacteriaceae bacterium]
MCGRYAFFSDEENIEIRRIAELVDKKYGRASMPAGEIFPTDKAVVLLSGANNSIDAAIMNWGYEGFKQNVSIINARAETADSINMFAKSMELYRCIVPSTGFYEWAKEEKDGASVKSKYLFNLQGQNMVYMAGLYNADKKFTIITTKANESMEKIHNRMPLIIEKKNLKDWIFDREFAYRYLKETPPHIIYRAV